VDRPLTTDDQRRLVSALLKLDGVRKRSTRELLITALERELGHPIPVVRYEQDLYDVWGLIDACLSYPGAVRCLISVLDNFHMGSRSMMEIRVLVDEMLPEPLLDPRERRDLYRLLEGVAGARAAGRYHTRLVALYRDAVGPMGPALNGGHDLPAVISQLEEVTADPEGVPPLLRFLEYLATYLDTPAAAELRSWVDEFAARHRIDAGTVHQIRDTAPQMIDTAQPSAYLVVELTPDGVDPEYFLLSAWLQYGDEPGLTLRRDDKLMALHELPAQVASLLVEDHHVTHRLTPELTIEFVLPRRLLGHPVDQWRITIGGLERRLGIEYPVVVRSLDRLRQQAQHHNWRRKWAWLRDNPGTAAVCWVNDPGEIDGEGLYNSLLSERSTVCLALAFAPPAEGRSVADELEVGLQAGAPVLAWCRDQREPRHFAAEFQRLLDKGLLRLPENALLLRRQAVKTQDPEDAHLGFHLTLVFDNADRVPEPYVRLSPPV
jgi:hypothetical protein